MARQRKKKGRPVSGWLILDKPEDVGSTEAVSKVKWLFKAQKAGHAGTLDPLASGMLPIALGEATKTVPYVMEGRKTYVFTVTWGNERTTDDLEGEIMRSSDRRPSRSEIEALLPQFTGEIDQVPPQFSAIKIAGERAYDVARDGEHVEIPARRISVHRFTLVDCPDLDMAVFEVECGKGTYVRALARDLGRALGCFGHVSRLRRTRVAPFDEDAMVPLSALAVLAETEPEDRRFAALDAHVQATSSALSALPHITVSDDQASRLRLGNAIVLRGRDAPLDEPEACALARGRLVAIGEIAQGAFHPKRVFAM